MKELINPIFFEMPENNLEIPCLVQEGTNFKYKGNLQSIFKYIWILLNITK